MATALVSLPSSLSIGGSLPGEQAFVALVNAQAAIFAKMSPEEQRVLSDDYGKLFERLLALNDRLMDFLHVPKLPAA